MTAIRRYLVDVYEPGLIQPVCTETIEAYSAEDAIAQRRVRFSPHDVARGVRIVGVRPDPDLRK